MQAIAPSASTSSSAAGFRRHPISTSVLPRIRERTGNGGYGGNGFTQRNGVTEKERSASRFTSRSRGPAHAETKRDRRVTGAARRASNPRRRFLRSSAPPCWLFYQRFGGRR